MKKIYLICLSLIISLSLIACTNSTSTSIQNNDTKPASEVKGDKETCESKPTQKELNEKLKKEATKASFVEINGHEDELKGKKVFIEGEVVTIIDNGVLSKFLLKTKEGKGYGMYHITGIDTESDNKIGKDIKEKETVKVYGTVYGKDDTGMPNISVTIIEKLGNK